MKTCQRGHQRPDELNRCKLCKREVQKLWHVNNKEIRSKKAKANRLKNKKNILTRVMAYNKNKYHTDVSFRLKKNLRNRLNMALKNDQKIGSAVKDLGCTGPELKKYLESIFQPGMSWENYGNKEGQWSIDHKIALSTVDLTNREEFLKVSHYTNLQPMWHVLNLKKSNKLTY